MQPVLCELRSRSFQRCTAAPLSAAQPLLSALRRRSFPLACAAQRGEHRQLPGPGREHEADVALLGERQRGVRGLQLGKFRGQVVELAGERQIDAVTGVTGSGPAYVFHLIEAMAAAGEAEGLSPEVAMQLARATVCGAGELAFRSPEPASQLRINVTSPGGTTAAALAVLMDEATGLPPLLERAIKAAADRGRELGK